MLVHRTQSVCCILHYNVRSNLVDIRNHCNGSRHFFSDIRHKQTIRNQYSCQYVLFYWTNFPKVNFYAQYTPPTMKLSSCVASVVRTQHTRWQSWPSLQFPVLISDDIMTSLWKTSKNSRILHYTADSNVYKHAASYVTSYPTSIALAAEL